MARPKKIAAPVKVGQATPKPAEPEIPATPFVNTSARTLHYGDGRRLLPGESDFAAPELVAIWRGAGFVA